MAFQIDEKHLSKLAQEHMHNAKSKAKLTRDAIEYYVRREEDFKEFVDMKEDVAEIKELLKALISSPGGSIVIDNGRSIQEIVEEPIKQPEPETKDIDIPSCYE